MDALAIEKSSLRLGSPTRGCLGSASNRANTTGYDGASKIGRPEKSAGARFTSGETTIRIAYDKEIERIVVQILDKESATVVKQFPAEEAVAFLRKFRKTVALVIDGTV